MYENNYYPVAAQFLGEVGRLQEAAEMYESIIDKESENFELVFNTANILRQVNRNQDAEQLFYKATLIRPMVNRLTDIVVVRGV